MREMNIYFWPCALIGAIVAFWKRRHLHHYFTRTASIYALAGVIVAAWGTALFGKIYFKHALEFESFFFSIETVFNLLEGNSKDFRVLFNDCSLIWKGWAAALSVLVPLLTVGTVVILIAQHCPRPAASVGTYYVFSHLDYRTLLLAEDIQKHKKDCVFYFLRTDPEEVDPELRAQLWKLPYRCFPYDEKALLQRHPLIRRKYLRFFFLSENTDENFQKMKDFLEIVKEKKLFLKNRKRSDERYEAEAKTSIYRQELYLLSETVSAPMLIDNLRKILCDENNERLNRFRWTELRLLDRYRSLSYELLQEVPLYQTAYEGKNNVLILGFGRVGMALFRTMVSFSSMVNHEITFTLCDSRIHQRYYAMKQMYPECGMNYPVKRIPMDAETCEPAIYLGNPDGKPYTMIVVCLGDDERNIKVASQLKRYYRKWHWNHSDENQPYICVNVEDQIKSDYTKKLFEDRSQQEWNHMLHPFGTDRERFSVKTLMPRNIWTAAQNLHWNLQKKNVWELPYWSEYERRSSIACVCHAPYHVASVSKTHDPTDPEYLKFFKNKKLKYKKKKIVAAEHRRWMDYVRTEGMQSVSLETVAVYYKELGRHLDVSGQLTPCLVPYKGLGTLYDDLKKQETIKEGTMEFKKKDQIAAENALFNAQLILSDLSQSNNNDMILTRVVNSLKKGVKLWFGKLK